MFSGRPISELVLIQRKEYHPDLCKTCQRLGVRKPQMARARFSDCEEHFQKRVRKLWRTGVKFVGKSSSIFN
jgi:hypothetical protein